MWARASLFRRLTDHTNVYGKCMETMENSPQNIRGYTDIFTVCDKHYMITVTTHRPTWSRPQRRPGSEAYNAATVGLP